MDSLSGASDDRRPLSRSPLWQQAWQRVRADILTGRIRPGERINEARLARQYGISRNPIREALRQLIQEGLVVYRPNVGTVVSEVSMHDVRTATDIRVFLETRAAEDLLAAGSLSGLIPSLEQVAREMSRLGKGMVAEEPEALDAQFHAMIIEASGSALLRRLWALTDPYTYMTASWRRELPAARYGGREHSLRHQQLLRALRSRDVRTIRKAIAAHIRSKPISDRR